jgi:hypothetical protein
MARPPLPAREPRALPSRALREESRNHHADKIDEVMSIHEKAAEGGFTARAVGESIFTEAETLDALRQQVRDAVNCHFDKGKAPKVIRLHFVRGEARAC